MTDREREVCEKVVERINKKHKTRLSVEDVFRYFKLYGEYIAYCMSQLVQVRIPYIGTFRIKVRSWYKKVYEVMMIRKGMSKEYIDETIKDNRWRNYLPEIKEYDKVIRDEWEGIGPKQTGDIIIPDFSGFGVKRQDT